MDKLRRSRDRRPDPDTEYRLRDIEQRLKTLHRPHHERDRADRAVILHTFDAASRPRAEIRLRGELETALYISGNGTLTAATRKPSDFRPPFP